MLKRRTGSSIAALAGAGLFSLLVACQTPPFSGASLALLDARVIDIESGEIAAGKMIVIDGDRIIAVESSNPARLPADVQRIDAAGAYVLPGLWDSHIHGPDPGADGSERVLPLLLAHGVTSVRNMGLRMTRYDALRALMNGAAPGTSPRLMTGGPLLDGVDLPWYRGLALVIENPEEVPGALSALADREVDFFKIYGGLSRATYTAIADYANANGVPFAGHVPTAVGIEAAASMGQRTMEHLDISLLGSCVDNGQDWANRAIQARWSDGGGWNAYHEVVLEFWEALDWRRCDAAFTAMARRGVYLTPTLVMFLMDRGRLDPGMVQLVAPAQRDWCIATTEQLSAADGELRERAYDGYKSALRRAVESGVAVLAGSDSENNCLTPGASLHWELDRLVEAGFTPLQALQAATIVPAQAFRRQSAGRIAPGYDADLVLFAANPLEDIARTRDIAGVLREGVWHDTGALAAMRSRAAAFVAAEHRRLAEEAAKTSDEAAGH